MHGDTVFRHFVHGVCTDLYLYQLVVQAEDGRMESTVAVGLGIGNEVLDTPLLRLPEAMYVTKRDVAIGCGFHQDAESYQVMNLAGIQG